ncbi:t-SNARE [Cunninghamella echinulata]|nr:t-SNARE [Cunninghamella echinulata]
MNNNVESDLFNSYQQEFKTLSQSIQNKLEQQLPNQVGDERSKTISAVERELDEVDEIIGQMDMELLNMPTASRSRLQTQLKANKAEYEKMKRDLKQLSTVNHRKELFGDLESQDHMMVDLDASSIDQRQRLLSGTERLGESSRRLEQSHRIALETESVGANILSTLKGQRETMTRARDTLAEADAHIDTATRTLKTMARRITTNKFITAAIILILVVLIIIVIYSKLF